MIWIIVGICYALFLLVGWCCLVIAGLSDEANEQ